MRMPAADDTIVAVSTTWAPSPLGVVRVSGPDAYALVKSLGADESAQPPPGWTRACVRIGAGRALPAQVFWFRGPRSYTGQDVIEIHTVGCLPLLRELAERLIELGARRALPGEFTARALIHGRMDAAQVQGVLALMASRSGAAARQAARSVGQTRRRHLARVVDELTDLLALIEAGIDFVEEEDIRFISPTELSRRLAALSDALAATAGDASPHAGRPHIVLVGLPNAGKSSLFNALVGYERALVSPVLGTTRDVLSAEVRVDGVEIVLQDCAGLGTSESDLEAATHVATERAAQQADLVLWVHPVNAGWTRAETTAWEAVPAGRRLLIHSKADLFASPPEPSPRENAIRVSALTGDGIPALRAGIRKAVASLGGAAQGEAEPEIAAAREAVRRAQAVVTGERATLRAPELVAIELRAAMLALEQASVRPIDEAVLDRIFAEFCVGK